MIKYTAEFTTNSLRITTSKADGTTYPPRMVQGVMEMVTDSATPSDEDVAALKKALVKHLNNEVDYHNNAINSLNKKLSLCTLV